jgi:hypothetical protein
VFLDAFADHSIDGIVFGKCVRMVFFFLILGMALTLFRACRLFLHLLASVLMGGKPT